MTIPFAASGRTMGFKFFTSLRLYLLPIVLIIVGAIVINVVGHCCGLFILSKIALKGITGEGEKQEMSTL